MVSSAVFLFLAAVLAVLNLTVCVGSRGFYSVEFLNYSNPGQLCKYLRTESCGFHFKITFRNGAGELKNFTTKLFKKNTVHFQSTISDTVSNPFVMNVSTFQDALQYSIEVWVNATRQQSHNAKIGNSSGSTKVTDEWRFFHAKMNKSHLVFRVKMECYPPFYGDDCSTRCELGYDKDQRKCNSSGDLRPSTDSTHSSSGMLTANIRALIGAAAAVTVVVVFVVTSTAILDRRRRKDTLRISVDVAPYDGLSHEASTVGEVQEVNSRKYRDDDVIYSEIIIQPPDARPNGQRGPGGDEQKPEEVVYLELDFLQIDGAAPDTTSAR